jgi:hypothetical protein
MSPRHREREPIDPFPKKNGIKARIERHEEKLTGVDGLSADRRCWLSNICYML